MNGGPLSISHALGRGHVTLKKDLCLPGAGLLCALRSLLCSCLTILQGCVSIPQTAYQIYRIPYRIPNCLR